MTARLLTVTRKESLPSADVDDGRHASPEEKWRISTVIAGNRTGIQGDKQTMQLSRLR
ncbi:hypothetical protein ACULNC_09725 [Shigella flexneri]